MCVVAAAAASWLALLAASRLYPAVCQTAKQGKRWDKWLFMICHIPSSLLSPGPIYYRCRLPPCRRERAHTQILNTALCVHLHSGQTHTCMHTIWLFPISCSVQNNISPGQFVILSSALLWELSKLHLICTVKNQTLHFSQRLFALSGTWLTSGISLSLSMFHMFHCAKLSAAGPNKSWITQRAQGSLNNWSDRACSLAAGLPNIQGDHNKRGNTVCPCSLVFARKLLFAGESYRKINNILGFNTSASKDKV